MQKKNMIDKYHFSIHLQFKKDCNVNMIEEEIGLIAYRKNSLSESIGKNNAKR